MPSLHLTEHTVKTGSHTTFYLACGPVHGPLIIFVHGWPELSISWRHQLPAMAALGFRAVAPDMRGYGRSSVYDQHDQYAQELIVGDMIGLLDALAGNRRCGSGMTGAARWCGTSPVTIRSAAPLWPISACPTTR